jgi:hypothetical protein
LESSINRFIIPLFHKKISKEVNMAIQDIVLSVRQRSNLKGPTIVKTAKGGLMAKGPCPTSGNTVCAMMNEADATKAIKAGEAKKGF